MTNSEIAQILRHVAAAFTIKDEAKHRFQIIAYQRAADSITNTTMQIKDLIAEDKIDEVAGIGESLKAHLKELIKNGKVKHFETVMKGISPAVFPLLDVSGFGPKKAYKLVTHFHLKNPQTVVEDIEKLALENKIASLEGFGKKSQDLILQHFGEFKKRSGKASRMLLPYANKVAQALVAYLKKEPSIVHAQPLGSLRRKLSTIGDIDIAVATKDPQKAIEHFASYPYKERIIEKGPSSASILTSGGHQVDLLAQPVEAWGSLLQHFTGGKHHNVHLREYALKKGLSLSEYGTKKVGSEKRTLYATEESFYKAVGLDYIPPELREDTGEIEAAHNHTLPNLVDLKDIKGDLHIHSSYNLQPSHDLGKDTMKNMLDKARDLKYEYLGFSEHNPSIGNHNKSQILSIMQKRKEYIEHIKESTKSIRVFNLLETDILPNGELAIDEKCLDMLDATLVSIHSSFSGTIEQMTKRVLQGLSHPKAKILSHPTGRKLNDRAGYQLDWEKVFSFCKEHNKALEINAWPERTDLPDSLIKDAIKYGVKMVINTDSHAANQMDNMQYGVWNGRRGWAQKKDILNTLGYNEFRQWLLGK